MEAAEDKLAAHAPWLDMDYDDSVDGVDGRSIGCWFPTGSSSPSSMSSEVIRGGGDLLASFSDELSSSDAGGNATWPAPPFMGTTGAVQNLHHVEEEAAEYGLGASSSLHPECTTELHSAWALLARDDALAWRRAACREPDALTDTERAKGGLLKLLQSDEAPQQLTVPAGTRGALSAYMHSTAELSAAVRSYLATTPDLFYTQCPMSTLNYGGKGGSQQLWWRGDHVGWKVTAPNRRAMGRRSISPNDIEIEEEDVSLLPPIDDPSFGASEINHLAALLDNAYQPAQVDVETDTRVEVGKIMHGDRAIAVTIDRSMIQQAVNVAALEKLATEDIVELAEGTPPEKRAVAEGGGGIAEVMAAAARLDLEPEPESEPEPELNLEPKQLKTEFDQDIRGTLLVIGQMDLETAREVCADEGIIVSPGASLEELKSALRRELCANSKSRGDFSGSSEELDVAVDTTVRDGLKCPFDTTFNEPMGTPLGIRFRESKLWCETGVQQHVYIANLSDTARLSHPELRTGLILTKVNGELTTRVGSTEKVMELLVQRPVTLTFADAAPDLETSRTKGNPPLDETAEEEVIDSRLGFRCWPGRKNEIIDVTFSKKEPLGLMFVPMPGSADDKTHYFTIAQIDPGSQGADLPQLRPSMRLQAVDGTDVAGTADTDWTFLNNLLGQRPISLTFLQDCLQDFEMTGNGFDLSHIDSFIGSHITVTFDSPTGTELGVGFDLYGPMDLYGANPVWVIGDLPEETRLGHPELQTGLIVRAVGDVPAAEVTSVAQMVSLMCRRPLVIDFSDCIEAHIAIATSTWAEETGASADDLHLAIGDLVEICSDEPGDGWWTGSVCRRGGKEVTIREKTKGRFPCNCAQTLSEGHPPAPPEPMGWVDVHFDDCSFTKFWVDQDTTIGDLLNMIRGTHSVHYIQTYAIYDGCNRNGSESTLDVRGDLPGRKQHPSLKVLELLQRWNQPVTMNLDRSHVNKSARQHRLYCSKRLFPEDLIGTRFRNDMVEQRLYYSFFSGSPVRDAFVKALLDNDQFQEVEQLIALHMKLIYGMSSATVLYSATDLIRRHIQLLLPHTFGGQELEERVRCIIWESGRLKGLSRLASMQVYINICQSAHGGLTCFRAEQTHMGDQVDKTVEVGVDIAGVEVQVSGNVHERYCFVTSEDVSADYPRCAKMLSWTASGSHVTFTLYQDNTISEALSSSTLHPNAVTITYCVSSSVAADELCKLLTDYADWYKHIAEWIMSRRSKGVAQALVHRDVDQSILSTARALADTREVSQPGMESKPSSAPGDTSHAMEEPTIYANWVEGQEASRSIAHGTVSIVQETDRSMETVNVIFCEKGPLGIQLSEFESRVDGDLCLVVRKVRPGSQASRLAPEIREGLILQAVNGADVVITKQSDPDMVHKLLAPRPLSLQFIHPNRKWAKFPKQTSGVDRQPRHQVETPLSQYSNPLFEPEPEPAIANERDADGYSDGEEEDDEEDDLMGDQSWAQTDDFSGAVNALMADLLDDVSHMKVEAAAAGADLGATLGAMGLSTGNDQEKQEAAAAAAAEAERERLATERREKRANMSKAEKMAKMKTKALQKRATQMKSDGKLRDEKRYAEALAFIEDEQWCAAEQALMEATSSRVTIAGSMPDAVKVEKKRNVARHEVAIPVRPAEQAGVLNADTPPAPPPRPPPRPQRATRHEVAASVHAAEQEDGFVIVEAPPAPPPRPQRITPRRPLAARFGARNQAKGAQGLQEGLL